MSKRDGKGVTNDGVLKVAIPPPLPPPGHRGGEMGRASVGWLVVRVSDAAVVAGHNEIMESVVAAGSNDVCVDGSGGETLRMKVECEILKLR